MRGTCVEKSTESIIGALGYQKEEFAVNSDLGKQNRFLLEKIF